ncbi:MAG TPA: methyltransferase domain-containing protein [Pyrinomonadaceae bacterium]|nr:methyltransferase domain-containing protein [Pyrinomonadaceae bacterium]
MFSRFKQRSTELERLDTGDFTPAEYAKWQREMRVIHRLFGEMRALRNSLGRAFLESGEKNVSVLDVGAGSGELLRSLTSQIEGAFLVGVELNADAVRTIRDAGLNSLRADAMKLPFADDCFDYVFCSLFLHHLDDGPAMTMLGEMSRVARKRIFVIDLNRSPVAYYFYKLVGGLFLQPFTLEDGALSILRSRPPDELTDLAERAGLKDIRVQHSRANRLILSGTK